MSNIWILRLAVAVALAGTVMFGYHWIWQRGFNAATEQRAARDAIAIIDKHEQNAVATLEKATVNTIIERKDNEELKAIAVRVATSRVRVGKAICQPAGSGESASTSSGNAGDSEGRLVRADIERDIKALTLKVEEGLATGRACQEKLKAEGFVE